MKPTGKKQAQRKGRLDEGAWLERALEALAAKGPQVLAIEKLCHELGVSRGSFYWHFKNRADFVRRMAEFWDQRFTVAVRDTVAIAQVGPQEKLLLLSQIIQDLDVTRFDLPIRALAAMDPLAAEVVGRADKTRYQFVRSLFAELGFTGDELDMRTRIFAVYHSLDGTFSVKEDPKASKRRRKLRLRLLTSR
jgi:AcrR family transcriptional regulator